MKTTVFDLFLRLLGVLGGRERTSVVLVALGMSVGGALDLTLRPLRRLGGGMPATVVVVSKDVATRIE